MRVNSLLQSEHLGFSFLRGLPRLGFASSSIGYVAGFD
jgi:hypothetical protein